MVRLSTVKTETAQPVMAGVNRMALWLGPVSCTSGTCEVTTRNRKGTSSKEMVRRIVFLAADIVRVPYKIQQLILKRHSEIPGKMPRRTTIHGAEYQLFL